LNDQLDLISFQALELIKNGLDDSWVTPSHKLALSQRATRICQSAKLKDKLESFLADLPLLIPAEPRSNTIIGRSLPRSISILQSNNNAVMVINKIERQGLKKQLIGVYIVVN